MIYELTKRFDRDRAVQKFKKAMDNESRIEIKLKHPKKSIQHNAYAHLLFSWFGLEYGETMEYVKQEIFKKIVNPDLFKTEYVNLKTGEVREDWKSFADLDSGQTTIAIDKFRTWSSKEAGIYLPEPTDLAAINEIEKQVINNSKYL